MESKKHLQDYVPRPEVYHPNILSPYFRSPFTDIFGSMINHQQYGRCTRFEMNMMECLEAYGLDKGKVKCVDLIDDFNECQNLTKQYLRHMVNHLFKTHNKDNFLIQLIILDRQWWLNENANTRPVKSRKNMHHHHIQMHIKSVVTNIPNKRK